MNIDQILPKAGGDGMTRLAVCAVAAIGVVALAEKLLEGADIPLWKKYGPWIRENKTQAIAILAALLYGASLALWPEEKKDSSPEGEGYTACT